MGRRGMGVPFASRFRSIAVIVFVTAGMLFGMGVGMMAMPVMGMLEDDRVEADQLPVIVGR